MVRCLRYAVCTIGSPLFIITELMPQGALLDYLRKPEGEALRLPTLVDMAADCANGMSHIESHGCVHSLPCLFLRIMSGRVAVV